QVRRAEVLDDVERQGGGGEQGREPHRRRGDVDERPGRDPGDRGQARPAAVRDALRDDVEDRRARHDEEQERRTDEERHLRRIEHAATIPFAKWQNRRSWRWAASAGTTPSVAGS